MKVARIGNDTLFRALCSVKAKITNSCILFHGLGDIHPLDVRATFPNARQVILEQCDKNFTYYWLTSRIFPSVTEVFLAGSPCDPLVLTRFPVIHLLERHAIYRKTWLNDRVKVMTDETYQKMSEQWSVEDLQIESGHI